MFKRPAWATTTSNPNPNPNPNSSSSSSRDPTDLPPASHPAIPRLARPASSSAASPARTAGRSPPARGDDGSDSIFRHAARSHDAIVAELAARRRREGFGDRAGVKAKNKKTAGKDEKRSKRSPTTGTGRNDKSGSRDGEGKGEDDGGGGGDSGEGQNGDAAMTRDSTPRRDGTGQETGGKAGDPGTRLKRRRMNAEDSKALLSEVGLAPIVVDDEDDEEGPEVRGKAHVAPAMDANGLDHDEVQIQEVRPAPLAITEDENDESDPELVELRRRARERQRQTGKNPSNPATDTSNGHIADTVDEPDPAVQLLITSPIPNTNPLIIYRKLSQRLQEVRAMYCQKQGFPDDFAATVFLTFCGRRKYDVTAVKSLGLEVDAFGTVTMRNGDFREEVDRIHLEAVTEELLARQKEEQKHHGSQTADGTNAEDALTPAPQQYIRLLIKAKGQPDFKLKVKPDTVISKIVNAAKREFQISSDTAAYLEFDGEQLSATDEVKDTEIEDLNCVDFHTS